MPVKPDVNCYMFGSPAWALDVEVYPNFVMIGALNVDTGQVRHFTSEPGIGEPFYAACAWFMRVKEDAMILGFNSNGYDNFILHAILMQGVHDPAKLYALSKGIIEGR